MNTREEACRRALRPLTALSFLALLFLSALPASAQPSPSQPAEDGPPAEDSATDESGADEDTAADENTADDDTDEVGSSDDPGDNDPAGEATPPEEPANGDDEADLGAEIDLEDLMDEGEDMEVPPVVIRSEAPDEEADHPAIGDDVHRLDEETLQRFNYANPNTALSQAPALYVRPEDGFGLRPNIGLRGGSAERSTRVTLMEDGVLFGPAPYSAPAAYYFPLFNRFVGTDIYLGPATLPYGPASVGGAIDFRSRPIPESPEGGLDFTLGSYLTARTHLHYGASNEWGGIHLEGIYLRSDGFKSIDANEENTGFDRGDIVLRGELHGALNDDVYHRLELRLGLGLEGSSETYLGLTDEDFAADAYRRYAASALDRMEWWRTQVQLRYNLELGESVRVRTVAYRHDFSRAWRKFNGIGGVSTFDVLLRPDGSATNQLLTAVLRGDEEDDTIPVEVSTNDRQYGVTGIQSDGTIRFATEPLTHRVRLGVRLHHDEIRRDHTAVDYRLVESALLQTGEQRPLLDNRASALAFAAYAAWSVTWESVTVTPVIRTELIWTDYVETFPDERESNAFRAVALPGLALRWAIIEPLVVFAGVHRGYSPVAPGQPQEVQPEDAISYEVGARFNNRPTHTSAQLAFYVNDYGNILGTCRFSGGCTDDMIGDQFNGGAALVLGLEASVSQRFEVDDVRFPVRANYTFTHAEFRTSFESGNPQFGDVEEGDRLPYVPEHRWSLQAGMELDEFGINVSGSFVSEMWEQAGQGEPDLGEGEALTDAYFLLDAVVYVQLFEGIRAYVRGENLTDTRAVASRRPFGARPNRPLMVQGGVRVDLH